MDIFDDPCTEIVAVARALDIDVTAEGVENRDELALLMQCGCHRAQGYLFARPLPREALDDYLSSIFAGPSRAAS